MTSSVTDASPLRHGGRPVKPRPSLLGLIGLALLVVVTVVAGTAINFTVVPRIRNVSGWLGILGEFLQPNWEYFPRVLQPLWETISTAVVATTFGSVLALAIAMLASTATMRNSVVYRITKIVLALFRSLPDVVWALLFVAMLGRGALAGVFALAIFSLGIVAKLTAETIDAVDPGPLEAVDAAGGSALQRARVAVVPQILPNYASYVLYVFELNIRASLVIGMVGAGGIGQQLSVQLNRYNYDNVALIIIVIFVLVFGLDLASGRLRTWLSR